MARPVFLSAAPSLSRLCTFLACVLITSLPLVLGVPFNENEEVILRKFMNGWLKNASIEWNNLEDCDSRYLPFVCDLTSGSVTQMNLNNRGITLPIPPEIANFSELVYLRLNGNQIPGTIPDLTSLTKLRTLDLSTNLLSGTIPTYFGNLKELRSMLLNDNNLTGGIPLQFLPTTLLTLDLSNNLLNGSIPDLFSKTKSLISLSLSNNSLIGTIPKSIDTLTNLGILNLQNNELNGSIPKDISHMKSLNTLNLASNHLTGSLPSFKKLTQLKILDVSHNSLSGIVKYDDFPKSIISPDISYNYFVGRFEPCNASTIPSYLWKQNCFSNVSCSSIPEQRSYNICQSLCGASLTSAPCSGHGSCIPNDDQNPTSFNCSCDRGNPSGKNGDVCQGPPMSPVVPIIISLGVLSLIMIPILSWIAYKWYRQYIRKQSWNWEGQPDLVMPVRRVNLKFLKKATDNFSESRVLGNGGTSIVYRGETTSGEVIAVKRLRNITRRHHFNDEVETISSIRHANLVRLLGYCRTKKEQILIYELVPNHSLEYWLHPPADQHDKVKPLSFPVRLRIALGICRGLHYLHSLGERIIVHRDMKSVNVLLTKTFEPKIIDFGLFRHVNEMEARGTTIQAGTSGYMDPEYLRHPIVTPKIDIFGLGVILLELISGREAIIPTPNNIFNQTYLYEWAVPFINSDNYAAIVDPKMEDVQMEALCKFADLAKDCVNPRGEDRPDIELVESRINTIINTHMPTT